MQISCDLIKLLQLGYCDPSFTKWKERWEKVLQWSFVWYFLTFTQTDKREFLLFIIILKAWRSVWLLFEPFNPFSFRLLQGCVISFFPLQKSENSCLFLLDCIFCVCNPWFSKEPLCAAFVCAVQLFLVFCMIRLCWLNAYDLFAYEL